jgi:hypothetical protein
VSLEDPAIKIVEKKGESESKEAGKAYKWGYHDFGVASIEAFDYLAYKGRWCRYCGARFTQAFKKGPWGKYKLCFHHFVSWKKKKLDLSKHRKEPKEPIDKSRDTEIKYLNLMVEEMKLRPVQTVLRLKEMML